MDKKISVYAIPAVRRSSREVNIFNVPDNSRSLTIHQVIFHTCHVFNVTPEKIKPKNRKKEFTLARHAIRWFCIRFLKLKPIEVRYQFHISYGAIYASLKTVVDLCETDKIYREKFLEVKSRLTKQIK